MRHKDLGVNQKWTTDSLQFKSTSYKKEKILHVGVTSKEDT